MTKNEIREWCMEHKFELTVAFNIGLVAVASICTGITIGKMYGKKELMDQLVKRCEDGADCWDERWPVVEDKGFLYQIKAECLGD